MLNTLLTNVFNNKLPLEQFPYTQSNYKFDSPNKVIVFFIGGLTYLEIGLVENFMGKVLFGADTIHNSNSFIKSI